MEVLGWWQLIGVEVLRVGFSVTAATIDQRWWCEGVALRV